MEHFNPLDTTEADPFIAGQTNLSYFKNQSFRCDGAAILLCIQGLATISVNLHRSEVLPYTLVFITPGTILMVNDISDDFNMSFVSFSRELCYEAGYRLEPSFFKFLSDNPVAHRVAGGVSGVENWMQVAAYTYDDRDNMFRMRIIKNRLENIFLEIYDKLQRKAGYVAEVETQRRTELFRKFINLLSEQCTKHREVAYYADRLCISPRYLGSIVRSMTHKSPKNVIDEFVILEIKILLHSTNLPAQEIAFRLNFPDQSYLGHYFRRHTGVSPVGYRRKN